MSTSRTRRQVLKIAGNDMHLNFCDDLSFKQGAGYYLREYTEAKLLP